MKNLEGQRIVMTGATGFIGRNVAEQLLAQGARVFALVRPESRHRRNLPVHEHLTWIEAAMEEAESCVPLIGHADGFLHFAWGGVNRQEIDSPEVQASNVDGSLACLEAACRLGCQVFMDAGSRVEYGITADGTMEESMECHPVNAYGKAKLEFAQKAEAFCRQNQMTFYHLRFFSVYGTGDHPWSIISTLVRELPAGNKVSLSACRHQWNFMYIDDAVEAVYELYTHLPQSAEEGFKKNGLVNTIVNIAGRDTRVLKDFVEEIHTIAGGAGQLEYGTFVQAKEGALSIKPDISRLMLLTGGWQERFTFRKGIETMMKKEKENKNL